MVKPLLILDRDGVINERPARHQRYILDKRELLMRETVLREIASIQNRGIKVVVASNQQCLGKGLITEAKLNEIHELMNNQLIGFGGKELDFYICGHLAITNCSCRKPKPGLLLNAIAQNGISCKESKCLFIGDSLTDQEAAFSAGIPFKRVTDEYSTVSILRSVRLSEVGLIIE